MFERFTTKPFNNDENVYHHFIELLNDKYIEYGYADLMADTMGISQRKLNEAVKNITGKTACQLTEEKIVFEAEKLLEETD
jgi:AraC-like DNA-binding protein